jgi:hypothetical protein
MFAAMRGDKQYVVIDGEVGTGYDAVSGLTFNSDSKKTAYAAKHDKKWLVVVDKIEQKECDEIMGLAFSPDSRHLAYLAVRDKKGFLVMDGVEQRKYDGAITKFVACPAVLRAKICLDSQRLRRIKKKSFRMPRG